MVYSDQIAVGTDEAVGTDDQLVARAKKSPGANIAPFPQHDASEGIAVISQP
jgi:hypothetical protein